MLSFNNFTFIDDSQDLVGKNSRSFMNQSRGGTFARFLLLTPELLRASDCIGRLPYHNEAKLPVLLLCARRLISHEMKYCPFLMPGSRDTL
jgi:hypothetical protein